MSEQDYFDPNGSYERKPDLPEQGRHVVVIDSIKQRMSRAENRYLEIQLRVLQGASAGKVWTERLTLTSAWFYRLQQLLKAACVERVPSTREDPKSGFDAFSESSVRRWLEHRVLQVEVEHETREFAGRNGPTKFTNAKARTFEPLPGPTRAAMETAGEIDDHGYQGPGELDREVVPDDPQDYSGDDSIPF